MQPNRRNANAFDELEGLTDAERKSLNAARNASTSTPRDPDELMARAYAKSGIDPLKAAEMKDPQYLVGKVQGPIIAMGGLLLAIVGCWRVWNAWTYSRLSIGGIVMIVIGVSAVIGGLAGTSRVGDTD